MRALCGDQVTGYVRSQATTLTLRPTKQGTLNHFCHSVIKRRLCKVRSLPAAFTTSSLARDDILVFCLDSAVADLTHLTILTAYQAAQELWPERVVGPVGLYVDKARAILPVLAEPHHAVVLVRLLSDEGVIGARSTAGREGPVVGRAVRHTGSRPLLVAEIAEHWPVVMDSCLLRWSLEPPGQTGQSKQQQDPGPAQGRGSAGQEEKGSWGQGGGGGGMAADRGNKPGRTGRDELLARARAAFLAAQVTLMEDDEELAACLTHITPHTTAVEALKGCSRVPLTLASTLPTDLGVRVLERCGLSGRFPEDLDLVSGPSWAAVVSRVVGRAKADGCRVQIVTGNLARLEELAELRELESWDPAEPAELQQQQQQQGMPGLEVAGEDDWPAQVAETEGGPERNRRGVDWWKAGGLDAEPQALREGRLRQAQADTASCSGSMPESTSIRPDDPLSYREGAGLDGLAAEGSNGSDSCNSSTTTTSKRGSVSNTATRDRSSLPNATRLACAQEFQEDGEVQARASSAHDPLGRSGTSSRGSCDPRSAKSDDMPRPQTQRTTLSPNPQQGTRTRSVTAASAAEGYSNNRGGASKGKTAAAAAEAKRFGLLRLEPSPSASPSPSLSPPYSSPSSPRSLAAPWPTLRTVHLAEWSCSSMSYRARALSYQPRASLLSEHQLAEWLGVTHLDIVMDGVAWR